MTPTEPSVTRETPLGSPIHPHEKPGRDEPPIFDKDGRCLVCCRDYGDELERMLKVIQSTATPPALDEARAFIAKCRECDRDGDWVWDNSDDDLTAELAAMLRPSDVGADVKAAAQRNVVNPCEGHAFNAGGFCQWCGTTRQEADANLMAAFILSRADDSGEPVTEECSACGYPAKDGICTRQQCCNSD